VIPDDEEIGAGEPSIVLVHAFPVDRRMWRPQIERVGGALRTLAVDLRGFGASRDMPPARSIVEHADDLAALIEAKRIERAIIVGLSMGGYVALAFAARHPTKLAGLLLADTKATADSEDAKLARAANADRARKQGVSAMMEAMLPKLVGPRATEATKRSLRTMASEQPPGSVVAALEAMRDRPDRTNELASIRVPTRVVVGADDAITPPTDAQAMVDRIAGAKLVQIPNAGHFANLDDATAFTDVVLELARAVSSSKLST